MGREEKLKKERLKLGTGRDIPSKYNMLHYFVGWDEWHRIANDPNDCFHDLIPKHLRMKGIPEKSK